MVFAHIQKKSPLLFIEGIQVQGAREKVSSIKIFNEVVTKVMMDSGVTKTISLNMI